jgi:hypothetical protein
VRSGNALSSGDFDRYGPLELIVVTEQHLTETALPESFEDGVTADFRGMEEGVGNR